MTDVDDQRGLVWSHVNPFGQHATTTSCTQRRNSYMHTAAPESSLNHCPSDIPPIPAWERGYVAAYMDNAFTNYALNRSHPEINFNCYITFEILSIR